MGNIGWWMLAIAVSPIILIGGIVWLAPHRKRPRSITAICLLNVLSVLLSLAKINTAFSYPSGLPNEFLHLAIGYLIFSPVFIFQIMATWTLWKMRVICIRYWLYMMVYQGFMVLLGISNGYSQQEIFIALAQIGLVALLRAFSIRQNNKGLLS